MTPLARRLLVAAGGIPLLVAAVWAGGWWFQALVSIIGLLAVEEAFVLLAPGAARAFIWPARWFVIIAPLLIAPMNMEWLMLLWVAASLAVAFIALWHGPQEGAGAAPGSIALLFYPGALLLHFAWLRQSFDWELTLYLMVLLWAGDTAAYTGGRMMGRHKLAPEISPNKTWEGALWALVFSLATGWLTFLLWSDAPFSLVWFLGSAAAVWLVGMLGDLFESLLKRNVGVKDSSRLLSEHGGILDRFDSLLFATIPLYYLGLWWM